MSECRSATGIRCKFVARYNTSACTLPPDRIESVVFWGGDPEAYRERTYVCDVCVTCGKTTKVPK